jgi:hypothetical protein
MHHRFCKGLKEVGKMADQAGLIELKKYENEYNVLAPTTQIQQISPFHRIRVEFVKVDPDPEKGDTYKVGSKCIGKDSQGKPIYEDELTFSKVALMKFADAAGITWNWRDTRAVSITPDYVYYEAVGALRKPSGEWIALKGSVEIDLKVKEQEIYQGKLEYAKKLADSKYDSDKKKLDGKTPEQWAKEKTAEDMLRERKYKLRKAETAAMERVIRNALQLKQKYSPKELEKPFAIPKVDFSPDYNDPSVRKMMLQQGIQASNNLFGATPVQAPDDGMQMFDGAKPAEEPPITEVIETGPIDAEYTVNSDQETGKFFEPEDDDSPFTPVCDRCGKPIKDYGGKSVDDIATYSNNRFNAVLCGPCLAAEIGKKPR